MTKFDWSDEQLGILHRQGSQLYSAKNELTVIAAACERLGLMVMAKDLQRLSDKINNTRYEVRKVIRATVSKVEED